MRQTGQETKGLLPVHRRPAGLHSPSTLHLVSLKVPPQPITGGKPNVQWLPGTTALLMRMSR